MNRVLCLVPLVALVAAGLAPTPARADDRPPECQVLEFSRTSPLCDDGTPCRLSDDLRSACSGADLAFTPTRGGGFVLHSPPVRTWPRRLVTLDRKGAALSAPFVWDGQAGRVHVAPDGRPEAWLYGRRDGNGVAWARPDGDSWELVDVMSGFPAVALDVAWLQDGRAVAVVGHAIERDRLVRAVRGPTGSWASEPIAPLHVGGAALATDGRRAFALWWEPYEEKGRLRLRAAAETGEAVTLATARDEQVSTWRVLRAAAVGRAGKARPAALFIRGDDVVLALPAGAGYGTLRVGPRTPDGSARCGAPAGAHCNDGATCTDRLEGIAPWGAFLVRTDDGRAWLVAAREQTEVTYRYALVRHPVDPVSGMKRPPEPHTECRTSRVPGATTRELVVSRVERGLPTVDRIPLGEGWLMDAHAEGDAIVLGVGEPTVPGEGYRYRSVTWRP